MSEQFQVRGNTVLDINDALRQMAEAVNRMPPAGALVLYPDGQTPPTGWKVADGSSGRPDLRAFGLAGYVFIVRLG